MKDAASINEILGMFTPHPENTLAILHEIQNSFGYISEHSLAAAAAYLGVSKGKLFADVSFYDAFTTEKQGTLIIKVCDGTVCHTQGSAEIISELENTLGIKVGETTPDGKFTLQTVRCLGECGRAPAAGVEEHRYTDLTPDNAFSKITNPCETNRGAGEIPVITAEQNNLLLKRYRTLEEYLAAGGFDGLKKALHYPKRRNIFEEVKNSGLRGRSGSGFPTGIKWESCYHSPGRAENRVDKYIIANGDEGDPGAFMDRWLMENNPYAVIEGMMIAGCSVGANKGYLYVRDEYPQAVTNVRKAIEELNNMGILGKNIFDTAFDFECRCIRAAESYLCGEESGLIESIEGKPGAPRVKPPLPTFSGAFSQPTVVNNIETFANVPFILKNGSEVYRRYGVSNCTGTKLISLSGSVKNKGLAEIEMGKVTLRELIYEIGGGMEEGKKFKCIQIGGPLGSYLTEDSLDIPIDYDSLKKHGATLGSGGVIVIDDTVPAFDLMHHAVAFLAAESCGTCTPCREGLRCIIEVLDKMDQKRCTVADIALIAELMKAAKSAARCAFGGTIGMPVMSILKNFPAECRDCFAADEREEKMDDFIEKMRKAV